MKSIQTLFVVLLCVALSSYKVAADVPNPGFNSLFIGHSFFRPFADGMPDYAGAAGIAGHSQSVVFAGGANGAPLALWNNPTKSAEIKAILDSGDVELFGMTTHENPTTEGYENWIDYALAKNPTTRFFVGLPWVPYPESYANGAIYASTWHTTHAGDWHSFIDSIRALYPGVDIYAIPYGQSAGELRILQDAGNLQAAPNLKGDAADSIFTDTLGHPGDILRDLGRLVWLNAIYDVDLSTYTYGPSWGTTDMNAIAKSIMDAHDPAFDAAYHNDIDGDRVGDSVDNCVATANPDQEDIDENGVGDACEAIGC